MTTLAMLAPEAPQFAEFSRGLARITDLLQRLLDQPDWIFMPVKPSTAELLYTRTGMTVTEVKAAKWIPLRRSGNGIATRYFLHRADLVNALRNLPLD
jgi:hypothetical protein